MTPPDVGWAAGVERYARDGRAVVVAAAGPVPGYLRQADGTPHTAETFSWTDHLAAVLGTDDIDIQRRLLAERKVRRTITKTDPLLFAVLYFPHHLRGKATGDEITFSDAHLGWARQAHTWMKDVTKPRESREAEFAPRATGKTTWWFLIIPAWAGAHKWLRFIAAFADTSDQSVGHLRTFRTELKNNALIRHDYPGLVHVTRNSAMRELLVDNEALLITADGFVFAARGADTSSLGLKVNERRPDLIILDDIEPHEGKYSLASVKKRRQTLTDAILPLDEYARVIWVGTTTRHGSLGHRLCELADGELEEDKDTQWISEEKFTARRWPPIITEDDGRERSVWPAKWSVEYLRSIEGTRAYAKNFDNKPISEDGEYWRTEDIHRWPDVALPTVTRKNILVLDPNVSENNQDSDWTGICVAGLTAEKQSRVIVKQITQVRLTGRQLKDYALGQLALHPEVQRCVIEVNQGVALWLDIFADFPVPVDLVMADFPKTVRAAMALNHYQARPTRVLHDGTFRAAESQMISFPNVTHDDMVDAVSWAVRYLLQYETIKRPKGFQLRRPSTVEVITYA